MFDSLRSRPSVFRNVMHSGRAGGASAASSTMFQALAGNSANANLPETLTVNSTSVAPLYSYKAENATASTWTATTGPTLPIASTGTLPTTGRASPVTLQTEQSVLFNAGQIYQASTTTDQIGTEDFCAEFLIKTPATPSVGWIATQRTGNAGWAVGLNSASTFIAAIGVAGGAIVLQTAAYAPSSWYHAMFFCDRDQATGWQIYLNGVLAATGDPTTQNVSLDNTLPLTLGGRNDFAQKASSDTAFFRAWKLSSWFAGGATNAAQWGAVAQERLARLTGHYAQVSTGLKPIPTTMTRASVAYLDNVTNDGTGVRQLFSVGNNWPRFTRRASIANGTFLNGALQEATATNLILQSETFDNATWTKSASAVTANTAASPTLDVTADALIADATNSLHAVVQAVTLTAVGYVFSCFLKAGNQSFAILEDASIVNGRAWFNLTNGTVGTVLAGIAEATCENHGNGWLRCSIRFTGTAAAHSLAVYAAPSDNVSTFTGDAVATSTLMWGAQCELSNFGVPTSYVPTVAASATRSADQLDYDMTSSFPSPGSNLTLSFDFIFRSFDLQAACMPLWISSASGTNTDSVYPAVVASGDFPSANLFVAGVNQLGAIGSTDIVDGYRHNLSLSAQTNNAVLQLDGATQWTDNTVTLLATPMTYLRVGSFQGGINMGGALIGNVTVKNV